MSSPTDRVPLPVTIDEIRVRGLTHTRPDFVLGLVRALESVRSEDDLNAGLTAALRRLHDSGLFRYANITLDNTPVVGNGTSSSSSLSDTHTHTHTHTLTRATNIRNGDTSDPSSCVAFVTLGEKPFRPTAGIHVNTRVRTNEQVCVCLHVHTYIYIYISSHVCLCMCVCRRSRSAHSRAMRSGAERTSTCPVPSTRRDLLT
jgi:hypothetical protein